MSQSSNPEVIVWMDRGVVLRCRAAPLPAISSSVLALMSSSTVPFRMQERSSNRLCREIVCTYALLHLSPPSSTSSSNFNLPFSQLIVYTHTHTHTHTTLTLTHTHTHTQHTVPPRAQNAAKKYL